MITIHVSEEFKSHCPQFIGAAIMAKVTNAPSAPELWTTLQNTCAEVCAHYTPDTIKLRSGIAATRTAYKAMGKDPSRYRPACEQLARRVLQGKSLNSIDTLADIGNIVSIASGYSTAMLDADKIVGNQLTLGIGRADEPYEGIGRGPLNIEHLPVYRDDMGGIATPTSDNVRTMTTPNTCHILLLINGYDGSKDNVDQSVNQAFQLLKEYAQATDISYWFY